MTAMENTGELGQLHFIQALQPRNLLTLEKKFDRRTFFVESLFCTSVLFGDF